MHRSRLGSSHELARTSSDRACFFLARLGSLVNFGSLRLVKIWLGPDRSKNLTARQLASQWRARKFYEIVIEHTIEQARNVVKKWFFKMSLNFLNFMHFQIVKNRYILPTFCLNPVFYWLIFGSDRLGPIFYWLVLARSGFFETEFWLGPARSRFFEQTLWLGPDRSWKKSARPKPSCGTRTK